MLFSYFAISALIMFGTACIMSMMKLSVLFFTCGGFLAVLQTGSVLSFVCQHVLLINLDNDFVYSNFIFKTLVYLGFPPCVS